MAEGISPETSKLIDAQMQMARDSAASSLATTKAKQIADQAQQLADLSNGLSTAKTESNKTFSNSVARAASAS